MEEVEVNKINFVPCVRWIKRGVANPNPAKVQLSKDELVKIIKDTKEKLNITNQNEGQDEAMEGESSTTTSTANAPGDEFNFENYDNEDEANTAALLGISSLAELPTEAEDNFSESDDSEKEDDLIKPKDDLILVGHVDGDLCILEIYVHNEDEGSLYVHHDIILPSFPLCMEWLNYEPNMPKGSYCAIGTMLPQIDVWDVDIMNCIEPSFTLGRAASSKKKRPHVGHTDAVLALAWNATFEHVLASGSVDQTILLWDLENKKPTTTITAFEEKVQCLEWHKLESQTLLAGGCDSKAKIFDCRTPETHQTWNLNGEAERITWNPMQPFEFLAGTNTGSVQCFDCRKGELWSLAAHSSEVTGLSISSQCPGLLLTAAPNESVKIWDLLDNTPPVLVCEKDMRMGNVHCLELCPESPFIFTIGGDNKSHNFSVYDLHKIDTFNHHFGSRELIQLVTETNSVSEPTS